MPIASKDIPKLTAAQKDELVRCYAIWCGVLPDDDVKGELRSGRRQISEMLKFFGKADRKLIEETR